MVEIHVISQLSELAGQISEVEWSRNLPLHKQGLTVIEMPNSNNK